MNNFRLCLGVYKEEDGRGDKASGSGRKGEKSLTLFEFLKPFNLGQLVKMDPNENSGGFLNIFANFYTYLSPRLQNSSPNKA